MGGEGVGRVRGKELNTSFVLVSVELTPTPK